MFLRLELKNMISNLSNDIEDKRATEDTKREDTCVIIFFILYLLFQ